MFLPWTVSSLCFRGAFGIMWSGSRAGRGGRGFVIGWRGDCLPLCVILP